jgi:hypothetical protein
MKKIIFTGILLVVTGLTIVGCKKDTPSPKSTQTIAQHEKALTFDPTFHVASDGRMLIFQTLIDYQKAVTDPSQEQIDAFTALIGKMPYTSYYEKLQGTPEELRVDIIGDDFFSQIINADFIVQIGDYLYKVNKGTGLVAVLPASQIANYSDLVTENKTNKYLRFFSVEEDVLESAEAGEEGLKSLFCSEGQASNPDWSETTYSAWEPYTNTVNNSNHQYVRRYKRECKMNYMNLGIYRNLQAKLEVKGMVQISSTSTGTYGISSFNTLNCIAHIRSKRIYKIRCQTETGWLAAFTALTNNNLYKCEYNSYRGTKGLKKYWLKGGFYYKTYGNGAEIPVYSTSLLGETLYQREIKSGY